MGTNFKEHIDASTHLSRLVFDLGGMSTPDISLKFWNPAGCIFEVIRTTDGLRCLTESLGARGHPTMVDRPQHATST